MIVRWTTPASHHFAQLLAYIANDSPAAADLVATRILTAIDNLTDHPLKGHPGREGSRPSLYELVIPKTRYTAVYRLTPEVVEILALVHQSRQKPDPS